MKKDSRMTIEDLAVLMEKRFTEQDKKLGLFFTKSDALSLESQLASKIDEKFDDFARMIARSFEAQSAQIQVVIDELREFKEDTNENFGKVRRDILNLDDRFVTHKKFEKFTLKLKTE